LNLAADKAGLTVEAVLEQLKRGFGKGVKKGSDDGDGKGSKLDSLTEVKNRSNDPKRPGKVKARSVPAVRKAPPMGGSAKPVLPDSIDTLDELVAQL